MEIQLIGEFVIRRDGRELDLPNRPDLAVNLSQLLIQNDRVEQAKMLIKTYYDADPSNMSMLAILLSTYMGMLLAGYPKSAELYKSLISMKE